MGMSTNLIGLRDPKDPKHAALVAVLEACKKAGINLPPEAKVYFDPKGHYDRIPDPDNALEVPIDAAVKPWQDDCREGVEVDLSKLPAGVKVLRFYNSW